MEADPCLSKELIIIAVLFAFMNAHPHMLINELTVYSEERCLDRIKKLRERASYSLSPPILLIFWVVSNDRRYVRFTNVLILIRGNHRHNLFFRQLRVSTPDDAKDPSSPEFD